MQEKNNAVDKQSANRLEETNKEIRGEDRNVSKPIMPTRNKQTAVQSFMERQNKLYEGVESSELEKLDRLKQKVVEEKQKENEPVDPASKTPVFRRDISKESPDALSDIVNQVAESLSGKPSEQDPGYTGTTRVQLGAPTAQFLEDQQFDFLGIPKYDKFHGSAWEDFYNSTINAGVVRTAQGIANLIPTIASATTDADWAAGWIDSVNDWADRNEGYVSDMGNKSFFDTWDIRSLAAGAGQGVGSIMPMIAAAGATYLTGGAATPLFFGTTSVGSVAGMAASTLNMMPSLVEEGLANGLTHQQASSLALAIAPVVGLMDKVGLDEAIKAGAAAGKGGITKTVIKTAYRDLVDKGLTKEAFKQGPVKSAIGSIASAHKRKIIAELAEEGIEKGVKGYTRKSIGATLKGARKEVAYRGLTQVKSAVPKAVRGASGEAVTESLQSLIETAGKQIYDLQFAKEGAEVGEGKFGADVTSKEAWIQALEEGFYGGLIGGTISLTSSLPKAAKTETIFGALESANKRGKLDGEVDRMLKVLDKEGGLNQDQKTELKNIINASKTMVKSMPDNLTDNNARHQIFKLSNFAQQLQGEIDQISEVEGSTMPIGMEDLATAKRDKLTQRLNDTKKAIADIAATANEGKGGNAIDLDAVDETTGMKKYLINDITGVETTGKVTTETGKTKAESKVKTEKTTQAEVTPESFVSMAQNEVTQKGFDKIQEQIDNSDMSVEDKMKATDELIKLKESKGLQQVTEEQQTTAKGMLGKLAEKVKQTFTKPKVEPTTETVIKPTDEVKLNAEAIKAQVKQAGDNIQNIIESKEVSKTIDDFTNTNLDRDGKEELFTDDVKDIVDNWGIDEESVADYMKQQGTTLVKAVWRNNKDDFFKILANWKNGKELKAELINLTEVKPTDEVKLNATETTPSPTDTLKSDKAEGVVSETETIKQLSDTGVREGGFVDKRQVLNAINKYIDLDYDGEITPEMAKKVEDYYKNTTPEQRAAIPSIREQRAAREQQQATAEPVTPVEAKPVQQAKPKTEQEVNEEDQKLIDDYLNDFLGDIDTSKFGVLGAEQTNTLIKDNLVQFGRILAEVQRMFPNVDIRLLGKLYSRGGTEILGRVYENRIDLNADKATQDILFHELAHKYSPLLSGTNLWKRGLDLIQGTSFMEDAKKLYPELTAEEQAEEALVMLIGEQSLDNIQTKLDGSKFSKLVSWLKNFWNKLKYALGKASAKDIAAIAAWDLTMRNTPVKESGLRITDEKLAKMSTNIHMPSFKSIKMASLLTKLRIKSNPDIAIKGLSDMMYDKTLEKYHINLVKNQKLEGKFVDFNYWKEQYSEAIGVFQENIDTMLEEQGLEGVEQKEISEDDDIQKKYESFLNPGEKLDENVRGILAALTDDYGNSIPIARTFGVLTHVSSLTSDPRDFIKKLNQFVEKTQSSIDKAVGEQLTEILTNLPKNISKPLISQVSSLVNVPHGKVGRNKNGKLYFAESNSRINTNSITKTLIDRVGANFNKFFSEGKVNDRRLALQQLEKDINKLKGKYSRRVYHKDAKRVIETASKIEKEFLRLTDSPIKLDWFGKSVKGSINPDSDMITKLNNAELYVKQLIKHQDLLAKALGQQRENKALDIKIKSDAYNNAQNQLKRDSFKISQQVATSYAERTVFRNVEGNQQMGYKIGGFMHKLFSKQALFERDWSKHTGIGNVGADIFNDYIANWKNNLKKNISNVIHSDGYKDSNGHKMYDRMSEQEQLDYQLGVMFGSLNVDPDTKQVSYYNSVGTVSNRSFMAFSNMPIIDLKRAEKTRKKILSNTLNNDEFEAKSLLPTDAALEQNKKDIRKFLVDELQKNPELAETFIQPFTKETYNEYQYNNRNELNKLNSKQKEQVYNQHLIDTYLDLAVDTMATNELVNRYMTKSMLLGDLAAFKTPNEALKRFDKTTSPVQNYDLRKDEESEQPETITIILQDVNTEKGNSASDSWSYFSPYLANKVQEQGGALVDYGNTHKPLMNEVSEDGELIYIKEAGESFTNLPTTINEETQEVKFGDEWLKYHGRYKLVDNKPVPVLDENGNPQLDHHGQIGQALAKLQAKYPDTPIMVTYASAVKGKKFLDNRSIGKDENGNNFYLSIEDFVEYANDGKIPPSADKRVLKNFGSQFNINKQLTEQDKNTGEHKLKKGVDVTLPTQLLNVAPSGLPSDVDTSKFFELLAKLTDNKVSAIANQLKDKTAIVKEAIKAGGQGVSTFVSDILEELLVENDGDLSNVKFDHYDIANVLQRYTSSKLGKGVKHRMNGAELLQTIDTNGDLEYMSYTDGDRQISTGTVKVPEGVAKIGDKVIQVRIPLSNKINIFIGTVVAHTPPNKNVTVLPKGWIDASNADNDGDKLFTLVKEGKTDLDIQRDWRGWINTKQYSRKAKKKIVRVDIPGFDEKRSKIEYAKENGLNYNPDTDKFSSNLKDELFDEMYNLLTHKSLWNDNNGYLEELTMEKVENATYQAMVNNGDAKDIAEAERKIKESVLNLGSMKEEAEAASKIKGSESLIGAFAIISKIVNDMSREGIELDETTGVIISGTVDEKVRKSQKAGKSKFTIDKISQVAQFLQGSLEDAKNLFIHHTGITPNNANMAGLALAVGYDLADVITMFRHPVVQIIESFEADGKKASEMDIADAIAKKYSGDELAKIQGAREEIFTDYVRLKDQAKFFKEYRSITQLDKGVSKDNVALMDFNTLLQGFNEYETPKGRNKLRFKNLKNALNNPVVQSRIRAQKALAKAYSDNFSLVLTETEIQELKEKGVNIHKTLTSLQGMSPNNVSLLTQKVLTKTQAKKLSKHSYNAQDLQKLIDTLKDVINTSKIDKNMDDLGWLNLVSFEEEYNRIIPTYRNSITSELHVDEVGSVSPQKLQEMWDKLDGSLKDYILDYAIHVEGLINQGPNITHLIPGSVLKDYFNKTSKTKATDVITREFLDNVAIEGRENLQKIETIIPENIGANEFTQNLDRPINSEYFNVNGYVYRTVNEAQGSITAELVFSPEETVELGSVIVPIYKFSDNKTSNPFTPINLDNDKPAAQNQEQEVSKEVAEKINDAQEDIESAFDGFDDIDLQVADQSKAERASKVNRRVLRRLSSKFKIPYKVINNPDLKVAGFYDPETNTVVINEAYATADTPIHEFAHPFVSSIKTRNPELYNNLMKELNTSEEGKKVLAKVRESQPTLSEEKTQEEAIVQMLGELAADKVTTPTLKQRLIDLFNAIKNIVKELFGNKADIIQEKMSTKTTLSELADMVMDTKSTISLDVEADTRFKRSMNRVMRSAELMKQMFSPHVDVVKASDVMSNDDKAIASKMKGLGLLSNGEFIIKRKSDSAKSTPLSFRVKFSELNTWKDKIKSEYPEMKVVEKSNSNVDGYTMYDVNLGGEENVFIHVPTDEKAFDSSSIAYSNIQFQTAAGNTRKGYKANTDSNVFGGLDFDTDRHTVTNVDSVNPETVIRRYANAKGGDAVKTVNAIMNEFREATKGDRYKGGSSDFVYSKEITDSLEARPELWEEYIKTGKMPQGAGVVQSFANAVQSFERTVTILEHLKGTQDYLLSNGKKVESKKVVQDIINNHAAETEQREKFFGRMKAIKKAYDYLTTKANGLKKFTLNMFTPEVFANIITGQKKGFLHQLVNDDMIEADAKHSTFVDEVNEFFRERVPEAIQDKIRSFSDYVLDEKGKARVVAIKGLSANVPVAKALSLYMALRQADVRNRVVTKIQNKDGSVTEEVNVSFFDEVKNDTLTKTINVEQFEKNFQNYMQRNPELSSLISAIDSTMEEVHGRVDGSVRNFMGVPLSKVDRYFPIRTGVHSKLKAKTEKGRIEDFVSVKERSMDTSSTLKMDDAFQMIEQYIDNAGRFNSYSEPVMNIRKLIKELDYNGGDEMTGAISYLNDMIDHVQDFSNVQSISDSQFDKGVKKLMNNFSLSVLGWNPGVALKQVVSIVGAVPELGYGVMKSSAGRKAASRILKNSYKQTKLRKGQIGLLDINDASIQELMDLDPLFKQRFKGYIDREQGDYRAGNANPFGKGPKQTKILGKKFQMDKTMEMIKIHDAAAIVWLYESLKESNPEMSKDQLKKRMREIVMRTQPSYNISSRTNLGRSNNAIMRLFTMFSSQRAKNMNMMANGILAYISDPSPENKAKMRRSLMSVGVLASVGIVAINALMSKIKGNDDDDDETIAGATLGYAGETINTTLGNIYFVGQAANMFSAYRSNKPFGKTVEHPAIQTVSYGMKSLAQLSKGEFGKALDSGIQTGFRVTGSPLFPYTNFVSRPLKSMGE